MPIYEFECKSCGLKFDYLVRGSQEEIICAKCKGKELKRLMSIFAFTSKDSSGNTSDSSSRGCGGCTSHNCSECSH